MQPSSSTTSTDCPRPVSQPHFTTSARAAWLAILQSLQVRQDSPVRVLVPAYIGQSDREGSGIFDPIRQVNAQATFFPVDQNLRCEESRIRNLLNSQLFDVLLVVHYFGFCTLDMPAIRSACQKHGVLLVEDCAHVGFNIDSQLGSYGDYSIFSLHKFFSVSSGGVLRINHPNVPQNAEDVLRRLPIADSAVVDQVASSNLQNIQRRRIENFQYLQSALRSSQLVSLIHEIETGRTPHNFPVFVDHGLREALYFYLLEQGIRTTALYYKLVEELPRDRFPVSFDVSNNILNLPVQQDISLGDLEILVGQIEAFYESFSRGAHEN